METVSRVFAAVPLPDEVRMAVSERLSPLAIPGRLVPSANWHLTLRFVGGVDEMTYERFLHGLSPVQDVPIFGIRLGAIGGFPNAKKTSVVWIGVEQGAAPLDTLNEIAEEAAVAAGLLPEERPFRPHLSISRVRPPESTEHLGASRVEVRWAADRVVVYRSVLGAGGARYEPLEAFDLRR